MYINNLKENTCELKYLLIRTQTQFKELKIPFIHFSDYGIKPRARMKGKKKKKTHTLLF